MNSRQVINLLKGLEQSLDDYCELNDEGKAAFRMAITALELFGNSEQLPSAQPKSYREGYQAGYKDAQSKTAERIAETAQNVSDEDLISRKAAIDAIRASTSKYTGFMEMEMYTDDDAVEAIEALPSAQPERKRGEWVKARGSWCTPGGDPVWECSECGKGVHVYGVEHGSYGRDVADGQWVSCPNCGADMRGEQNDKGRR